MAVNSTIKRKTASGYDEIHPKTNTNQVDGLSTALANVTISGLDDIGDVAVTSASSGEFLKYDGTNWVPGTISSTTNNYLTGVSGSGDGTVTFTRSGLSNLTWDASHNHSATDITSGTLSNARLTDLFKAGSEIPSGANLNNYRTTGYYSQNSNADASAGSNYPESLAGILEVITDDTGNGLHTLQRYTIYNNNNSYVRYYYNGSWRSWRKVWNSLNDGSGSGLDADTLDGSHASAFATAGHSHSNYVATSGDSMSGDLQLDKDGTTNVGSHGIVFQANTSLGGVGDYTRELNIDSAGNLNYNGNTIFHEGNDGSASGLHADLLDGQQGSYYLNYNNFTNTPTIPTDTNNYLTGVSGSGDGTVTFTRQGLGNLTWNAAHSHSEYLPLSGGTLTGTLTSRAIAMQNYDITGINALAFNDPGPNEGISWSGGNFKIYESPNDLSTNTAGNLQFVSGGARRMTVENSGDVYIGGGLTIEGSIASGGYEAASEYEGAGTNIILKGDSSGRSGIFFQSEKDGTNINHSSDFGFIQFHPYGRDGTSGEANELIIGVSNDSDDHLILNTPNATGIKARVGASATEYTMWHSGNDGSGSGLDADTLDGSHASTFAPKASPALTGTPTAPTAAANTNTTQIATTAYVQQEITDLIGGAPGALDTLNELAAAINDDSSYASTITTALAGKMSTSHPANNHTSTHLYMSNGDGFIWNDTTNVMSVRKDGTDYTNWDSGNLTNLNQLTNGPGYVTSSGVTSVATGSGLTGGTITGSGTLSHADTSSQASVNNSGNTFIQDITLDGFGHITGLTSATASTTDSTKLPLAGGTMTGDLTLDHDGTGTSADSHGVVFTARAINTDFSTELKMVSNGDLKFGTSTIFHSGNDGSSSGLHADLLDGQQGSYYLDYNNLSNTPTLITNNNQLTNGAGYVTANTQLSNEQVQDIVGAMVSSNSESGISVTYQDTDGTLDFNVNDPTITLTGDVTGSATMTNLGNVSITTTVGNDSHTHDGRYYTESEVDTLLAGKASSSHNHSAGEIVTGNFNTARLGSGTATSGYVLKSDGDGTASWQQDNNTTYSLGSFGVTATAAELNKMDGVTATTTELNYTDGVTSNIQTQLNSKLSTSAAAAAVTYVTSCPTSTNSTGMKVYVGSTDCSTKYTGWLYIVT